ncbi:hypothetical protein P9173_13750 [Bacillus safensis]|uniref:hypothetical protein n=1 Tax=Bacillus safensis TaxID=561879 RepID=UPI002281C8BF|nr:hypothetical protein [Bacillus safensis]MCY7542191.1 hypothetical protein [Bacillus safensis]MCY7551821.1 hypothetical protein [Bacillus safensis]MCY7644617.1 hypothetical protein [Bacillus safensis]MCY7654598.1 hypothetical protein [Bacillus safensis]MEC3711228.1 hypothetical protein [Bacillus safensis]
MAHLLIILAIILVTQLLNAPFAKADWSNWQRGGYGHQARVFTDDTNYYKDASTVDWRAEKKGSSTLYYTAGVYKKRSGGGLTDTNLVQRGSFKASTPLKSFSVKEIRKRTGRGTYVIQLDCYTDSAKTKYIGTFESVKFNVR